MAPDDVRFRLKQHLATYARTMIGFNQAVASKGQCRIDRPLLFVETFSHSRDQHKIAPDIEVPTSFRGENEQAQPTSWPLKPVCGKGHSGVSTSLYRVRIPESNQAWTASGRGKGIRETFGLQ